MCARTIFELAMLLCFGFTWPLTSWRMLCTHRAEGRGLLPTSLVLCGYLCGMTAKLLACVDGAALAPIFWMYLLNVASVSFNLALQWHFGRAATPRLALA